MRSVAALILVLGFATVSAHAEVVEGQKACGAGVYCADQMVCVGRIDNPPKDMSPDYYVNITAIQAIKTTKNLGGGKRALVDALAITEDSAGQTPNITLADAWKQADFYGAWYGAPARQYGNKVVIFWGGGFSQGYKFTITKSEQKDGYRLDTLTGKSATQGDVVPDYTVTYECEAKVVTEPTRVDDFTR